MFSAWSAADDEHPLPVFSARNTVFWVESYQLLFARADALLLQRAPKGSDGEGPALAGTARIGGCCS